MKNEGNRSSSVNNDENNNDGDNDNNDKEVDEVLVGTETIPLRRKKSSFCRHNQRRRRQPKTTTITDPSRTWTTLPSKWISRMLLHACLLAIYLIPMMMQQQRQQQQKHQVMDGFGTGSTAVLDELHLLAPTEHHDIYDRHGVTWEDIFTHDYWGRPMNSPSSHKSWRPFTILSFRYFRITSNNDDDNNNNKKRKHKKGLGVFFSELMTDNVFVQRLWNVITHAAVAEGVGILAYRFTSIASSSSRRQQQQQQFATLVQHLSKWIFALHPTHVEVTANAANRSHLLAVLCAVWLCDFDTTNQNGRRRRLLSFQWGTMFIALLMTGYLSSETFLFAIVPVAVTRALLESLLLLQQQSSPGNGSDSDDNDNDNENNNKYYRTTIWRTLITWTLLGASGVAYYALRYYLDWLSIPDGLIRPAENPFFALRGWDRIRSYSYVTVVHVLKAWDWDIVGFSHEYGHACILPITSWTDTRLIVTAVVGGSYAIITVAWTWYTWGQYRKRMTFATTKNHHRSEGSSPTMGYLLWILHLSWMVTLFPITGIVKVGTFVSDRIVVPASVGTTIFLAHGLARWWLAAKTVTTPHRRDRSRRLASRSSLTWNPSRWSYPEVTMLILFVFSWHRIHRRTAEWLGPIPLLESSLRTCPRSAKSHLEYSKTLSGLFPDRTDLVRARWHLDQVEAIDPGYCDVHQQFAHIAAQEQRISEFEERLTRALICPFTMGSAMSTWRNYWSAALDPTRNPPAAVTAAQTRQAKYLKVVDDAIAAEDAAQQQQQQQQGIEKSASPLVWKTAGS